MLETERNVKWIVMISLALLFVSAVYGPLIFTVPYYSYAPQPRDIWYYMNRVDILLFIATVTIGALFIAGFGNKQLTYRLTIYSFVPSMALFFLSFSRALFP